MATSLWQPSEANIIHLTLSLPLYNYSIEKIFFFFYDYAIGMNMFLSFDVEKMSLSGWVKGAILIVEVRRVP